MNTLDEIAQHAMDAYYQEDKSGDDFFKHGHFRFLCASSYAALLQAEFEKSRREAQQAELGGFPMAQLNNDWFIPEDLDVTTDKEGMPIAVIPFPVFSFRYDRHASGILDIYQIAGGCYEFIRIPPENRWQIRILPQTSITFWWLLGQKVEGKDEPQGVIHFSNSLPKKVRTWYIPAVTYDNNPPIPMSLARMVIEDVRQFFVNAKNGVIVDRTADQNPNKTAETEILDYLKQRVNG